MKNQELHQKKMSDENLEALCKHCGQTLSNFLHQMEEHNAEVVCPACGKTQDGTHSPGETGGTPKSLTDTVHPSPAPGRKRPTAATRPRSPIKP